MDQSSRRSPIFDRWPRYASRKPWTVVAGVVLIIVVLAIAARIANGSYSDDFSIPGTESQKAFDLLDQRFQGLGAGDSATVVMKAPDGFEDTAVKARVADIVDAFKGLPGVAAQGVASPYDVPGSISQSGTIAKFDVPYTQPVFDIPAENINALLDLRQALSNDLVQVELGGTVASAEQPEPPKSEIIGILAAIVILLVAFGSVVAMGLPILTALLGLIPGFMLIGILSSFVNMASFTPQFASMIGIGVGIDYALLIVTRFREGLHVGLSLEDAIVRAMGTAGRAVLFAGSIVVIALFGLWAAGLPFIGWVATAAAILVATLVIVALFILPAALRLIGANIDRWSVPFIARKHTSGEGGVGYNWAHIIARAPVVWLVIALAVGVAAALPFFSMRLGSSDAGNNPETTTTRRAYDLLSEGFGRGFNGPILAVFDIPNSAGVEAVQGLPDKLMGVEGVVFVAPPFVNQDQNAAIMTIIPSSAPQDKETGDTVARLRQVLPQDLAGTGVTPYVGGLTAVFIDIADKMSAGLPIFMAAVIGLSVILLGIVFRSILVPIKAALMIALSVGIGFGVVTAVFQWGWALEHRRLGRRGGGGGAEPVRARQYRACGIFPAYDALLGAVRPVDGLRGVPDDPGARGVQAHRQREGRDRARAGDDVPSYRRSGSNHELGVLQLHAGGHARHQGVRPGPGHRHPR